MSGQRPVVDERSGARRGPEGVEGKQVRSSTDPDVAVRLVQRRSSGPATVRAMARVESITDLLLPQADGVTRTSSSPADEFQVLHSYLPFPTLRSARLLVPVDNRKAAAVTVALRSSARHGTVLRLAYGVAARALSLGLLQRLLRSRVDLLVRTGWPGDIAEASLVDHIGALLGRDVFLSVKVGPADPHRTVGMHIVDPDGRLVAFVKVASSALSRRLLRTEATALTSLPRDTAQVMDAPRLLHHGDWNGLDLLVTTPLDLSGGTQPVLSGHPGTEALLEVAASGPRVVQPLVDSAYWRRTTERVAELLAHGQLEPSRKRLLADLVHGLESSCGNAPLDFGGWHGDWLPWNLTWKSGRLLTWDWEYWTDCVPVGFDLLHYFCGTSFFREGMPVRDSLRLARDNAWPALAGAGVSPAQYTVTYALYVLEFLLRRLDILTHGGGQDDARVFPAIFAVAFEALLDAAAADATEPRG